MSKYPFVQAKNFGGKMNPVRLAIVHSMEYPEKTNAAEFCADFFAGIKGYVAPKASAHYVVDSDSIIQCVLENVQAWHTPGMLAGDYVNAHSIGIEHAGYAAQSTTDWLDEYSSAMLERSAQLMAEICVRHRIPIVKLTPAELAAGNRGICGHVDCTVATKKGSHTDPGPNFPWDHYIERVAHYATTIEELPVEYFTDPTGTQSGLIGVQEARLLGWPEVRLGDFSYLVCPVYIPYVSIGAAQDMAKERGMALPSPDLVDAIWRQADLKLDGRLLVRNHNGGTQDSANGTLGMASPKMLESQNKLIESLMGGKSLQGELADGNFTLMAGAFKDVCMKDGRIGIYGWQGPDGKPIQPFYAGHSLGWMDYSQAWRPIVFNGRIVNA